MNRWGSLYLVACAMLRDENRAGDLLLQARDEAHLESLLRQYGELPRSMPAPDPEVLEHVTYLRRRARLRRMLTRAWAAGTLLLASAAMVGLVIWRGGDPPAVAIYDRPAIASLSRGSLELKVHRAEATPGAVTIWWSLSGRDAGLAGLGDRPPFVIVRLFDRWRSPDGEQVSINRVHRDLLHGKIVVAEMVDRPTQAQLVVMLENERFALGFEVDRSTLAELERRIPVQQVMARAGVGVLVREVVQGPGYTRLVYEPWQEKDSPFRLLSAPLIDRATAPSGEQADALYLEAQQPLRVAADLRLPLREGAKEPLTGLKVVQVRESLPGISEFTLISEGPALGVESFTVVSPDGEQIQRSRWGSGSLQLFMGNPTATFTVTHPTGGSGGLQLHLETLWLSPPEGLRIRLRDGASLPLPVAFPA